MDSSRYHAGLYAKKRFTLIEMLVVIAIISILASMLMPALGTAMDQARQITCTNQLKQWAFAMRSYSEDFGGYYPSAQIGSTPWTWHEHELFQKYTGLNSRLANQQAYTCPSWRGSFNSDGIANSYIFWSPERQGVDYAAKANSAKRPSKLVLLIDGRAQSESAAYTWLTAGNGGYTWAISWINTLSGFVRDDSQPYGSWADAYRHPGGNAVSAFWDLHVAAISELDLKNDRDHAAPIRAK